MATPHDSQARQRTTNSQAVFRRRRIFVGSAAGLLVVLVVVLVSTLGAGSSPTGRRSHHHHSPGTARTTGTVTRSHHKSHLCPLTGVPAGKGTVPPRPALGVKIGNDPYSRPQSGLLDADIVYEEMAEGGITRYLAVYQCKEAGALGPVRSVRWDDWHVLKSFGHPLLAFSGGINQWDAAVASQHSWLFDANGTFYPTASAYYRTTNRVPPWNLYTSTAALWRLDARDRTPPPPQFAYTRAPSPSARPDYAATIVDFAAGNSVVWRWDRGAQQWERYYGSQPDVDASGKQLHATNVLIQMVRTRPGPYAESGTVPDTESITEGHGSAYLLRDGKLERGTWRTHRYGDVMHLRLANGRTMALEPGNTWVEMVPLSYKVQFTK